LVHFCLKILHLVASNLSVFLRMCAFFLPVFLFISRSRKLINVSVEILLCQVIGPAAAPGLPDLFLRAKVSRSSLVQYHVVSVPCGRCCDASAGRRRGASFLCSSCTRRADTKSSRPSPGVELSDSAWRERRGCYRHAGLVVLSRVQRGATWLLPACGSR